MELIRLGGPAYGIVTKTVHKALPGGGWVGVVGLRGWWGPEGGWGSRGGRGPEGGGGSRSGRGPGERGVQGVVGVQDWVVSGWWGSRCGWLGGSGGQRGCRGPGGG